MCLMKGSMALSSGKAVPHGGKQPGADMQHYVLRYIYFPNLVSYPKYIYIF